MWSRIARTLAIFRLAVSYWGDSRRIARARRDLPPTEADQREAAILKAGAIRFRETALRLGGLIIKVGQFLSARTDLLPLAFTRELTALQDQVPEAPWDDVCALMEREWGRPIQEIFESVEEHPVAAASLGQVHRARLHDGREAAIKVQRPEIQRLAHIDLGALSVIMRVLERSTRVGRRINATRLFDEFQALVEHELDYRQEARYLERFRDNFADEADVVVPDLMPEYTKRRVFVMQYVSGTKLTEVDRLVRQGLVPAKLGDILIRAYLKQIAFDGFVQIDPHAGNFFADESGRIIFLDFGMMAEVPKEDLAAIVRLIQGILGRNTDQVVGAIGDLGFVRPTASPRLLKRAVSFLLDRLSGVPLDPGPQMDRAVAEFQDFLYHEPLEFPARYMFLGRAIGMLFGLVSRLNPDIDWMDILKREALPLLSEHQRDASPDWVRQVGRWAETILGASTGALVETAAGAGWRQIADAAQIPGQMRRVLTLIENGDLATQPEATHVLRRLDQLADAEQARLSLMWALALAAMAVGVGRVWPHPWATWVLGALAVVMAVRSGVQGRRGRRRLRRR